MQLLLNCYSRTENRAFYALHEVRQSPDYADRALPGDERPLEAKAKWPRDRQAEHIFVLSRNIPTAINLRKVCMMSLYKCII